MAKPKKTLQDLLSKAAPSMGNYQESTGGGTPMKKGEKIDYVANTAKEAQEYRKTHPDALVRVNQPRDTDGQFTFNSANKKTLAAPQRASKTIPPFLRGIKLTFAEKSGKGAIVDITGKKYAFSDKITDVKSFINAFKQYHEGDQEFGEMGNLGDVMKGKGGKTGTTITLGMFTNEYSATKKAKNAELSKSQKFAKNADKKSKPKADSKAESTLASTSKADTVDYSLAKSDPKKFVSDNFDAIQNLVDMASNKGWNLNVTALVNEIGNGNIKSFDEAKSLIV